MMCEYLYAKDGYCFNYCDEEDNKSMLKRYNKLIKSMKAIKPIGNLNSDEEFYVLDDKYSYPYYRFTPKNEEDIQYFIKSLKSENIELPFEFEMVINHIYVFCIFNDLGNFGISIFDKEDLDKDILTLQKFRELLEKGGKYESSC